jgi:hypothetical protein
MFDKFKQTIQQAGETIKEQAAAIGDAAKEKSFQIIDQWISNLPKMEALGLQVNYLSISVSINPTLEVEMQSKSSDFPLERIQKILDENPNNTPISLVFSALKTNFNLHKRAGLKPMDPLSVRITVRLSPEVKVAFGVPVLQ